MDYLNTGILIACIHVQYTKLTTSESINVSDQTHWITLFRVWAKNLHWLENHFLLLTKL